MFAKTNSIGSRACGVLSHICLLFPLHSRLIIIHGIVSACLLDGYVFFNLLSKKQVVLCFTQSHYTVFVKFIFFILRGQN